MIWDEQTGCELVSGVDEGFLSRLAEAVREARGSLSQRELGDLLGVSQSTVQQWEGGKNVPSLENLEKIARMKGLVRGFCGVSLRANSWFNEQEHS